MFRVKASRRCLCISSARTNPGYRLLFISSLSITHFIDTNRSLCFGASINAFHFLDRIMWPFAFSKHG
ncbi:TPA: hypothetical protein JBI12_14725 [Legionella pneumophila]|nr:hypothetical protein [Legionella pneumophila]